MRPFSRLLSASRRQAIPGLLPGLALLVAPVVAQPYDEVIVWNSTDVGANLAEGVIRQRFGLLNGFGEPTRNNGALPVLVTANPARKAYDMGAGERFVTAVRDLVANQGSLAMFSHGATGRLFVDGARRAGFGAGTGHPNLQPYALPNVARTNVAVTLIVCEAAKVGVGIGAVSASLNAALVANQGSTRALVASANPTTASVIANASRLRVTTAAEDRAIQATLRATPLGGVAFATQYTTLQAALNAAVPGGAVRGILAYRANIDAVRFTSTIGDYDDVEWTVVPCDSAAAVETYGTGCGGSAASFYEHFAPNTFDLSGTPTNSIRLSPLGPGYRVTAGSHTFVPPLGTGLGLTDDSLSAVLPLGFTLNYPGGSTSAIRICSNGFIHLSSSGTTTTFTPTVAEALAGGPRVFLPWSDWLPDGSANRDNVYYETGSGYARATWLNVREFGAGGAATMQCTFFANGNIEMAWQSVNVTAHNALVGFSPGQANRDPGNRDISATLPFVTGNDATLPLVQGADQPVAGSNVFLRVSNINVGSVAGVEFIGHLLAPGIDLTLLGMPGCSYYIQPSLLALPFLTSGASAAVGPIAIPMAHELVGARLSVQAMTVTPGANATGLLTSNAATLVVGTL